ncbi:YuzD family protein [Lysinibacillus sp. SGAir0095]|uniref:YuzD family protein n=1 Tax=Lysinibacillus sp. SGAir0095 TaxID=2070463 RepID=UPI0010CD482F|nr:YuzD family protein [Lysinibacillus sp. SGAir0095]QCR33366.1 disulfide oxidoreductase [Lysinibacillus sp. SGAir0095]
MIENNPIIEVFGTEVICASCVNAPSSKDTYEWLQAAISRKFPNDSFSIRYVDIEQPLENERDKEWAEQIQNDEFFYPLVLINGNVIGEGYIQIQPIFSTLEKLGFVATE